MHFPGPDYQYFFRWHHENRQRSEIFRELGIRRFWIKNDADVAFWNKNKRKLMNSWDEILDARGLPDFMKNPQSCPDTVNILSKNGVIKKCGVWSVSHFDEEDLHYKCSKYDTVLINFDVSPMTYMKQYNTKYAQRTRWIMTAREFFPRVRMIHAGAGMFDLQYCLGLDGQMSVYTSENARQVIYRPDGTAYNYVRERRLRDEHFYNALGEWRWLDEKYPDRPVPWYYYKMLLMIPEYQEYFYSPQNRIVGMEPEQFSGAQLFFGYFLRNSRITPEKMWGEDKIKRNRDGRPRGSKQQQGQPLIVQGALTKRFTWNDAILCDTCSLNYCCMLYRKGGACTVPGSQGSEFAAKFASRDARVIMEGMGSLLEKKAVIVEQELDKNAKSGEAPDKDTMKLAGELFKEAATLAKLRDPTLTRPKTAIQINGAGGGVAIPPPPGQKREISAAEFSNACREIEAAGIARELITQEVVEEYIYSEGQVLLSQPALGIGKGAHQIDDPYLDGSIPMGDDDPEDFVDPAASDSEDEPEKPPTRVEQIF
ncbi:hypothetical protein SEA_CAMERICO_9 [Gordonia phage Camerico]|nr:hypothetical protein SEA_CAMERICO_9 [Gordonia phage Camerico]